MTLETGVRVYRPLTGNNSNTILKHTRTLMTRMALDDELRNIVGQGHKANFDRIDNRKRKRHGPKSKYKT